MSHSVVRHCPSRLDAETAAEVRARQQVLALWSGGQSSTFCIAQVLELTEEEVCRIINDAEATPPPMARRA